jgi:hypothetical protein
MKKAKIEKTEAYRKRKLEILEEMLHHQKESTAALKTIAESLVQPPTSPPMSLALSPIIKF